jgi:hypothetical protein
MDWYFEWGHNKFVQNLGGKLLIKGQFEKLKRWWGRWILGAEFGVGRCVELVQDGE